jgi:hypothetical protein
MDKSITQSNARFQTGASNARYCDCVGFVLLHMWNNGFNEIDESLIPRGLTKYLDMIEILKEMNFTEVEVTSSDEWLLTLMYYDNENGHLGVYFPDVDEIHHMAPYGKAVIRPDERTTFWRYHGN